MIKIAARSPAAPGSKVTSKVTLFPPATGETGSTVTVKSAASRSATSTFGIPFSTRSSPSAMFPMVIGTQGGPVAEASLVCNFPDPSAGQALMEHNDVTTTLFSRTTSSGSQQAVLVLRVTGG